MLSSSILSTNSSPNHLSNETTKSSSADTTIDSGIGTTHSNSSKCSSKRSRASSFIVPVLNKITEKSKTDHLLIDKFNNLNLDESRYDNLPDRDRHDSSYSDSLFDLSNSKSNDHDLKIWNKLRKETSSDQNKSNNTSRSSKVIEILNGVKLREPVPKSSSLTPDQLVENSSELYLNDKIPNQVEKIENNKCSYCELDDPNCVVQCADCSFWFCNGKSDHTSSHVIYHLNKSGHNRLNFNLINSKISKKSCNICSNENIFQLGFISSKKNKRYLLCRPPCSKLVESDSDSDRKKETAFHENPDDYFAALDLKLPVLLTGKIFTHFRSQSGTNELISNSLKKDNHYGKKVVNIDKWQPLVDSTLKCLISLILKKPSPTDQLKCNSVSKAQIDLIEKQFKKNREKSDDNLDEGNVGQVCDTPSLLCYENGREYKNTFVNLLELERSSNKCLDREKDIGNLIVAQRLNDALSRFEVNLSQMNPQIYDIILGKKRTSQNFSSNEHLNFKDYSVPNLADLNESQHEALEHALNNCFTLIQGPPGTGKTHLAACLIYNLIKRQTRGCKILVCAPSNFAADHLAAKINQTNLSVVRILSKKKQEDQNYRSRLYIHNRLNKPDITNEIEAELATFLESSNTLKNTIIWFEKKKYLEKKLFNQIVRITDVVVVTCMTSACKDLKGKNFDYLLVDEVGQATEPEILVPLTFYKNIQKCILIGDIKQLSPVIKNRIAAQAGLDQSLFQRLVVLGNKSFMLNKQYRSHPFISKFSRITFYDDLLQDGITAEDRNLDKLNEVNYRFPIVDKPILFFCCKNKEQIGSSGFSYSNQHEAMIVGQILNKLLKSGVEPKQIGVISPYDGQVQLLKANIRFFCSNCEWEKIEIASINAFQGREKDFIILTTVRSNKIKGKGSIGFLSDVRRLNVALTRAKYGMILVGDPETLCNQSIWYELLKFYNDNGLIFEGSIDNMKSVNYLLKKPKKCNGAKENRMQSTYHIKLEINDDENPEEKKSTLHKITFNG